MAKTDSGSPGRPRRAETDQRIRDAALHLLRSEGPGPVNIDAVAVRSGVARTTIYRRYRSREELMTALLDDLVDEAMPAPSAEMPEKVLWLLERIQAVLDDGIGRGGVAAVLTGSDPAFTTALRTRMTDRLETLQEAMEADVRAGHFDPGVDPDILISVLFGAYLGEVLRYAEVRPGWAARTVKLLTPALSAGRRDPRS